MINFIILYVVLMSLFIVVDLIVDLDEFLKGGYNWALHHTVARQADEMGLPVSELTALVESDTHPELIAEKMHLSVEDAVQLIEDSQPGFLMRTMGVFWLVGDYYGPLLVLIYAFFSGLIVVAAMGFTLSGLGRSREMTAMVSSGISLYRVAMPIILAGIVLNTLALPVQEFVVPELAGKLGRKKSNIKNISVDRYAFQYIPDEKGALLTAAKFDPANEQLEGLRIILRENGMQVGFITASTAQWDPDRDGWELFDAYQIVPSTKHLDDIGLDVPGNESIPIDFYATDLSPTLIKTRQDADYVRLLPVSQLQQMQNSEAVPESLKAVVARTKWGRICLLIVNVLILAMGLPYFLLRSPANMMLKSVMAAGMCIGCWAGGMTLPEMASGWLNPVAAAWFPVVVYLPLTAYLLQKVET